MKYLLDTNACIRYINGRSPRLRERVAATPRSLIGVSTITKAEMFYGSAKSQTPARSLEKQLEFLETIASVPFDDAAAIAYGTLRVDLERNGTPVGQHDMLIAAIAVSRGLTLVSHNTREFERIKGVTLEDWEV
jgi:tRNA(fMet)-specific endonuclease VapC